MGDAALFALPSWDEAFGLVYGEALLSGAPILLCSDSGFAQFAGMATNGRHRFGWSVKPQDVTDLAHALDQAMAADELEIMGRTGREWAKGRFSWNHNARTLLSAWG